MAIDDDAENARADYLSQWRDDLAGYLSRDLIEAAVDRGVTVRPYDPKHHYFSWIDASSGASKFLAAACAHKEGNLFVLDALLEIRPPFDAANATAEVVRFLKSYGLRSTMGDDFAARFVRAEMLRERFTFEGRPSGMDRSRLYSETSSLLHSGRAKLLDDKRLVNQYAALERRLRPGHHDSINQPNRSGHHDDLSNVVAGTFGMPLHSRSRCAALGPMLSRSTIRRPACDGRRRAWWHFLSANAAGDSMTIRSKHFAAEPGSIRRRANPHRGAPGPWIFVTRRWINAAGAATERNTVMAKNDPVYSAFSRALRARYKTPRAALRALGLDENLILQSRRGLAFDNNPLTGKPETEAQKTMAADPGLNGSLIRKVVDFCAAHIDDGEVLNELEEMLTGIKNQIEKQFGAKMPKTDGAWRADGQIRKRQVRRRSQVPQGMGMSEDQIGEVIRLLSLEAAKAAWDATPSRAAWADGFRNKKSAGLKNSVGSQQWMLPL